MEIIPAYFQYLCPWLSYIDDMLILLLAGLAGLWIGTKWVISGALGVAEKYRLSHSFAGIAIFAVGTDLPEVFVSVNASLLHLGGIESSGIITGNAIGSSISQITFIMGTAGLLLTFKISSSDLRRDSIALFTSIVLLFLFGSDELISRWEGATLIAVYIGYYFYLFMQKSDISSGTSDHNTVPVFSLIRTLLAGFTVLIISSHFVVKNAMQLAELWGVAQSFVGIVIIGLGTSLPELAVSIGAALKRSPGMTVGNIIGSNIFDGLIPVGLGGVISTVSMDKDLLKFDLPFLFATTILVLIFLASQRGISKAEGLILAGVYILYIAVKIQLL